MTDNQPQTADQDIIQRFVMAMTSTELPPFNIKGTDSTSFEGQIVGKLPEHLGHLQIFRDELVDEFEKAQSDDEAQKRYARMMAVNALFADALAAHMPLMRELMGDNPYLVVVILDNWDVGVEAQEIDEERAFNKLRVAQMGDGHYRNPFA